jgi:hypothetical protein
MKIFNYLKWVFAIALAVWCWLYIASRREQRLQEEQRTYTEQECEAMEEMVELTNEMIQRYE